MDIQEIGGKAQNGERGKGPLWVECDILPTSREEDRDLRSVEKEYKATKIKGAVRLNCNEDPAIQMMREFEERGGKERTFMVKESV